MSLYDIVWRKLLDSINQERCTPFIGAGASSQWLPIARDIACKWAQEYDYPLDDSSDLTKVAQFLAIQNDDEFFPKDILSSELRKKAPNFSLEENRNTPYAVLADLNLPIYITTNYDYSMEEALQSRGKGPVSEFCRWSEKLDNYAKLEGIPSVFDIDEKYESTLELKYRRTKSQPYKPSISEPLVYHLHGIIDLPQSMVLTENDYLDFIGYLNEETGNKSLLPSTIRRVLAATSLLFIGYSLQDINFRIIYHSIMNFIGRKSLPDVAVMRPPIHLSEEKLEVAKVYLEKYTKYMFKINVVWGDAYMFPQELRKRFNYFKNENQQNH